MVCKPASPVASTSVTRPSITPVLTGWPPARTDLSAHGSGAQSVTQNVAVPSPVFAMVVVVPFGDDEESAFGLP